MCLHKLVVHAAQHAGNVAKHGVRINLSGIFACTPRGWQEKKSQAVGEDATSSPGLVQSRTGVHRHMILAQTWFNGVDGVLGCCRRACGAAWGVRWRSGSGTGVRGTVWRDIRGESDDCFDIARGEKTSSLEVQVAACTLELLQR